MPRQLLKQFGSDHDIARLLMVAAVEYLIGKRVPAKRGRIQPRFWIQLNKSFFFKKEQPNRFVCANFS